jgi:hypothetical protein
MSSVRVDELLAIIRGLSRAEQRELIERAARDLGSSDEAADPLAFIGMFTDEPELIEAVREGAMRARERDPLRLPGS